MTAKTESPLLKLPLEVRCLIYEKVVGTGFYFDLTDDKLKPPGPSRGVSYRHSWEKKLDETLDDEYKMHAEYSYHFDTEEVWRFGILRVSKAVSKEALDVLYGQNAFIVDVHDKGPLKLRKFNVNSLRRIRHLQIVARPVGKSYNRPLVFDPRVWLPLLEGLRGLCIMAQQPWRASRLHSGRTLSEKMSKWITWFEPILKYFSTNLPKTTTITFDTCGFRDTTSLMDKYFGTGYKKMLTITGDYHFERGQYTIHGCGSAEEYSADSSDSSEWSD